MLLSLFSPTKIYKVKTEWWDIYGCCLRKIQILTWRSNFPRTSISQHQQKNTKDSLGVGQQPEVPCVCIENNEKSKGTCILKTLAEQIATWNNCFPGQEPIEVLKPLVKIRSQLGRREAYTISLTQEMSISFKCNWAEIRPFSMPSLESKIFRMLRASPNQSKKSQRPSGRY